MNETGFKCPKCGQTESFTASAVVVIGETRIGPDGWDYWSDGGHVELYERAFLHCEECGFSAHHGAFEEGPARRYRVLVEYADGDSWEKDFDDASESLDFYRKCAAMRRQLMDTATVSAQRFEDGAWKTVFKSESFGLAWV